MTKEEILKYIWEEVDGYDLTWDSHCEALAEKLLKDGWHRQVEAEWIVIEKEDYWIPDITVKSTRPVYKCSACEKEFGLIALKYNYCPNCGAKMDGGSKVK